MSVRPGFGQDIEILYKGSFKGELNGKKFENHIRSGASGNLFATGNLFTIETSNDDFVLTINWPNINSIDEIEKQYIKLPAEDNSVIISFFERKSDFSFVITRGFLHIYQKDSHGLNGKLEFTALSRFTNDGKNSKVTLLNGNFRIDFRK